MPTSAKLPPPRRNQFRRSGVPSVPSQMAQRLGTGPRFEYHGRIIPLGKDDIPSKACPFTPTSLPRRVNVLPDIQERRSRNKIPTKPIPISHGGILFATSFGSIYSPKDT